jgi:uncharacterized protein (TIGR02147 family)
MDKTHGQLDVFAYLDFRKLLADLYRRGKSANSRFSHRFIASQVGAASTGWFADILKGRSNLSGNHLVRLLPLFGLTGPEEEYFENLVRYDQAGSTEEKTRHYRKILSIKGVKPDLVGRDQFEFYGEWYHAVVRELLFFYEFKGDYTALARKLSPPITAAEAKKSIQLLEKLGFLKKGPAGSVRPQEATLKKDPAFKAIHLQRFMQANAQLGMAALEIVPKEERDISAMTLSLSASGLAKAKEEFRALRNRLLALTESDPSPERVYHCNLQLFPVTR